MELRQLSYFLAAAQTQNFRKAAELCLVAQPALSRQIAALEAELGVQLFKRIKQRVILTPEGQEFASYVRGAMEQLQQGQQAMARLQDSEQGVIQIGCVEPLTTAFLPNIYPLFHQRYPNIQIKIRVSRTDDLLKLVEQGEVDLGLIFNPDKQPEVLVVQELFRQPLQAIVSAHHPLARQKDRAVTLRQLRAEPLFLLSETSRLRRAVDRIFAHEGIAVQPVLEIEAISGLKELIKRGNGISFMLEALLIPEELEHDFVLLPIEDVSEEFVFALVYHRIGVLSLPARHFINTISDSLSE